MGRVLLDKYLDDQVSADATDVWTAPDVPNGQRVHLLRFGAMALGAAIVALQVRVATGPDVWRTVRAVAAPGQGEFAIGRDYVGDGVLAFRVVRQERSSSAQVIAAWLEGYRVT